MNKTVKVAFAATLLSTSALSGAAAHTVKKDNIHSTHPWVEALGCSNAAADPIVTHRGLKPFSLYEMTKLVAQQASLAGHGGALASIGFPDHDLIGCPDGSFSHEPEGSGTPTIEPVLAPASLDSVESEQFEHQIALRQPEPLPDMAEQRPAKAKPRRPIQVEMPPNKRLPISLIWSPREAAELAATMSVATDEALPRVELSFDVGLY